MTKTMKRYLVSSLITFVSTFAIVVLASIDSITIESISNGAVASLAFTAFRAGIKAVLEMFVQPPQV
jgi:uncharacterized MnhB-related membrane protein